MAKETDKHEDDDDYGTVSKMAERLGLEGEDKDRYVHRHMTGLGYKTQRSYVKDEDDEDDDGGFLPGRRRGSNRSDTRDRGERGGRNRRRDNDDWY